MRRRVVGALAFAGAAAGSTALGYYARKRALAGIDPEASSTWSELHRPIHGRAMTVRSFDGTRLHAEVIGPEAAPTLVLVHGYALSQHAWHYQRRDLQPHLRLVCYDQRGHGASAQAASGDYSIAALGRDLAAVLDATVAAGQPVVLAGHSMGGMTILSLAEHRPEQLERVAGVALLSTAAGNVVAGGAFSAGAAALSVLRETRPGRRRGRRSHPLADDGSDPATWTEAPRADTLFLLTRAIGLSPNADPAHIAFTEQLLAECPARVKAALGPTLTSLRLRHAAERLTMPGVVMVGDADRLTPDKQARRLADSLPQAELVMLADVGHMAPLEAHEEVTTRLRDLTEKTAGGA